MKKSIFLTFALLTSFFLSGCADKPNHVTFDVCNIMRETVSTNASFYATSYDIDDVLRSDEFFLPPDECFGDHRFDCPDYMREPWTESTPAITLTIMAETQSWIDSEVIFVTCNGEHFNVAFINNTIEYERH